MTAREAIRVEEAGECWRFGRHWIRYLAHGRRAGATGLADFAAGDHFFGSVQVPSELAAFGNIIAAAPPERAMEVGTYKGGTLFFLARLASPRATLISVDLPYRPARAKALKCLRRRGQRLEVLQGDSHSPDILAHVKGVLAGRALDYLFIDGDHSYNGVKRDFEMYSPLVRSGGIVAFHDICEHAQAAGCEVSRFWNEVKPGFRHIEIVENWNQGWAGIGVLYIP